MTKAFENYKVIEKYCNIVDKHRAWLMDYEGLDYSKAEDGKHKIKWKSLKRSYSNKAFEPSINCIARKPNRLIIEFDDEPKEKAKENLEKVYEKLKELKYGFIRSSHKGKCDYLWVEFTRDLTTEEAKLFLDWIAPENSVVDLNFSSDNKVFPVLYAIHWKHSIYREEPVEYFEGEQIDYDSLGIQQKKLKTKTVHKNNFDYEVSFNYEYPEMNITSLEGLEKIIKKNFPSIWFETKACLAACATLSLKNLNGCPSLNLVGNPSGEKTTVLAFFYGQDKIYMSDDFTPKSFVSHSSNVRKEDLEKVDLLPKIKNKVLVTPELAPLFKAPKEKIIDNFAMLTRVLDGEGLNRDSGTHGHRGYSGDYKFVWLGATTPLKYSVWSIMGTIGNRLFFLNMREKNRQHQDYVEMFSGISYDEKVKECRGAVINFLNNFYQQYGERELDWDAEGDIFILQEIIKYAQFLSKLRGSLMIWKGEEKGTHEYSFPIIEEPPRAINSLYNLAKGHALIHGRKFLNKEDLEIVKAVTFSSMPHDRYEFLKVLAKHEGKLTTTQIEHELNCSQDTALRTMKIFEILGVVKIKSIHIETGMSGRPMKYIEIQDEFLELLEFTQVSNDEIKSKSHEISSARDDFKKNNPRRITQFHRSTHPENDEINIKSQQNRGVTE